MNQVDGKIGVKFSWVSIPPAWNPHADSGEEYGVWFYDDPWDCLPDEELSQMRSYKLVLNARPTLDNTDADKMSLEDIHKYIKISDALRAITTDVIFTATCILKSFIDDNGNLDLDRLISLFAPPGLFEETRVKLERRVLGIVPEPVIMTDHWYYEGATFLEYTPKDADYLAGPFEYNGKLGAMARIFDTPKEDENGRVWPYRVYVAGNDDYSWSLYCDTRTQAEKELNYLLQMQPLRHKLDILSRGYTFTN